ncbi:hypothetical protein PV10_04598 [Exophiala mesophila]|uniref:AMP-dependent synthetase/ligase domain-containing protein n=1 Tax=Exophiala mesophila TaxID=212818 RepID=A0A0D1ZHS0_EXOME|nr:uncharacterized protein PV10_04598 [Exophiala mesophila]KIV93384.1 hypothetical protein PV10_04598 [Exophiala mesophila]
MDQNKGLQDFTPSRWDPAALPNLPIFNRLVNHAHLRNTVCVRDVDASISMTHHQLLTGVVNLRNDIHGNPAFSLDRTDHEESDVSIGLLAPGGCQFAVGFLATLALGAVCVPLSTAYPQQELSYFVQKARIAFLLVHHDCVGKVRDLRLYMKEKHDIDLYYLCLKDYILQPLIPLSTIIISSQQPPDESRAGLVIFTSGTSGPPKGAVLRRRTLGIGVQNVIDLYSIEATDVIMHCLPVHHATGILVTFLPFITAGGCVEFHHKFDAVKTWERWARGDVTYFSGVPTIYSRLVATYKRNFEIKEKSLVESYKGAAARFKGFLCGTSSPNARLRDEWKLLTGKRLIERYGASEIGIVFSIPLKNNSAVPIGSAGRTAPGVDMKLSSYPEGEIMVRRPDMLSEYLYNPDATRKALDNDGYFRTGDLARVEGEHYFILGRMSTDILKSGGYKISALDVEREILDQDYVDEAIVVGMDDEEFGQRVAAAIVLKKDVKLSIDRLRKDLSHKLARYKLPTVLRVVQQMPKTPLGKISKAKVTQDFFGPGRKEGLQIWQPQHVKSRL